ncbi:unnamed protein product [Agarophyton chilense]|eukprot:gb/GEZJ01002549.1/.p1 GENE.gb/GEZJ01002549.1/~~gb/GEZJ01002549.1/.p1  ORF type:complete len:762 (+),score=117.75 gb/GEZJ01002549.1/:508-2793(+)
MVSLQVFTVRSFIVLLVVVGTVTNAAPVQHHGGRASYRQLFNITASYGFKTNEKANKTILLNNGAAENRITYILHLQSNEAITAIIHISTDPKIITTTSEIRQQLPHQSKTLVNFTLLHEFDGHVGVANYNLLVYTNVSQYRASGTYTVAGIVVFASEKRTPMSIASGINSPGLAFNPSSSENNADGGYIRLELLYQPVGSDIIEIPPSLKHVLSNARVEVKDVMYGINSTLVSYDDSCSLVKNPMESIAPSKPSMRCGICFNDTDQNLYITVNPERSGTSIIQLTIPDIEVDEEIFETDIRVFVKKPAIVHPVVLIQPDTKFVLDYFGTEVIYLQMYNIIQPDQPFNATDFIIDLDMGRYASIDISLSRFEQPIQTIAFVVQPPGKEDPGVLKKIQVALASMEDSVLDSLEQTPDVLSDMEPMPTGSIRPGQELFETKFSLGPFALENTTVFQAESEYPKFHLPVVSINDPYSIEQLPESSVHSVYIRMGQNSDYYESNVHVIIPPPKSLRTAKNVLNNPLLTIFASNETAIVSSVLEGGNVEHVLVFLFLADYSIPTFSEHKSRQLSQALANAIGNKPDETVMSGNLTQLISNSSGIVVTYAIPVPNDSKIIANDVKNNRVDIRDKVASEIWIPPSRLALLNAVQYDPSSPSIIDAVSSPESVLGGLSGPLLAVIIVLVIVALIPLSALCFGYMMAGTEQTNSSSPQSGQSSESPPKMPPVLRDTLGRASEEENQDSFKMDEEMRQQGYYDASVASSEQ